MDLAGYFTSVKMFPDVRSPSNRGNKFVFKYDR